jgi:AraC-like DNA-binding protein
VTTDQGHSRLSEAIPYNFHVSITSDSSREAVQHVLRMRCLGSGAGSVPIPTAGSESSTERLLWSAHEDIARLTDVLRHQQCSVVLRGLDGIALPIDTSAGNVPAFKLRGTASALAAPIHDTDGRAFASLELSPGDLGRSDSSEQLLRALIESAARSITERWFRLTHRRQWIVAALRRTTPHTALLLAVDRDQRVVAADGNAKQLLEQKGRRFERRLPLTVFFQPSTTLFRRRGYGDASISLRGPGDADPWIALVTAPDIVAAAPDHDARTMQHVRPRRDCLTRLLSVAPEGEERRGLSRSALKCVDEYIDANLDSTLDIDELAALARMSASHFTRSFNKSVGMTPHRYVVQCRIAKARELLARTDLSLTDIALNIGFSDQSHFSRRFQEFVGVPPGAYRRSGDGAIRR